MSARPAAPTQGTGRGRWHRRVGAIPLAYLASIVVVSLLHPFLPQWRWLLIHLLLLGAATNAILVWSTHFAGAVLRVPVPASRRGEAARLLLLNAGVVGVLVAGTTGPPWLAVPSSVLVFAAVAAHLVALAARLHRALAAPFVVTVHYYLAAAIALLIGIPAGGWMLVAGDSAGLHLFHAHVNVLGWISLTVLGTVLTLWPTVLRTRIASGAVRAAGAALPLATAGLLAVGAGVLGWWPVLAATGLALFATAVGIIAVPAVRAARARPPSSFAAWSIAAALGWLVVALATDAGVLLAAGSAGEAAARFGVVLAPLLAGFVAQVLTGALAYLLPVVLGGGPARVRANTAIMEQHWAQRVVTGNVALAVFLLPVGSYLRIATSLLVLAVLVQFLIAAARVLLAPGEDRHDHARAAAHRPIPGVAAGLALVLLAVLAGTVAQRQVDGGGTAAASSVASVTPTGNTVTIEVVADGMRFHPDRVEVTPGDRLVIKLTNADLRRHDLVLASGARTPVLPRGGNATLDAGVVGADLDGWCSLPGHRQQGMLFAVVTTSAGGTADGVPRVDPMADPGAGFAARDAALQPADPDARVHRVTMRVREVEREVAPGVRQRLWTFNGTAPGPVLRGRVGDVFEIRLVNDGTIDHGIDFHAGTLAPDRPMRPLDPGEELVYRFTATRAGVWMYHCSTEPMLHHIGNGMYGAVIIDPPDLPAVDREYVLVQSEFYLGADGEIGNLAKMQAEAPDAVVFNGYAGQYAHRPRAASWRPPSRRLAPIRSSPTPWWTRRAVREGNSR